jgi:hypothetical protein
MDAHTRTRSVRHGRRRCRAAALPRRAGSARSGSHRISSRVCPPTNDTTIHQCEPLQRLSRRGPFRFACSRMEHSIPSHSHSCAKAGRLFLPTDGVACVQTGKSRLDAVWNGASLLERALNFDGSPCLVFTAFKSPSCPESLLCGVRSDCSFASCSGRPNLMGEGKPHRSAGVE